MAPTSVELVGSAGEIQNSLQQFSSGAAQHAARARSLLASTTYWVYSPVDQAFGPGKFVGLRDMDFDTYETAVNDPNVSADFNGHRTRVAIENALGGAFAARPDLVSQLESFGMSLIGPDAFGNADTSKWMFIELDPPSARRNPTWERDELILALDLYFRLGRRVPDDGELEVQELSELLNSLPIHKVRPDQARFRNPNGVALKLANFRALDQPGRGMSRGGKRDQEVWDEFAEKPGELRSIADAIRVGRSSPDIQPEIAINDEDDDGDFPEGKVIYRLHRSRERNTKMIAKKKAQVLKLTGHLACEACGFDFAKTYGKAGEGYIECHHAMPLADVAGPTVTKLADLVLLCANCHRVVHRKRPWLSPDEVRALLT